MERSKSRKCNGERAVACLLLFSGFGGDKLIGDHNIFISTTSSLSSRPFQFMIFRMGPGPMPSYLGTELTLAQPTEERER